MTDKEIEILAHQIAGMHNYRYLSTKLAEDAIRGLLDDYLIVPKSKVEEDISISRTLADGDLEETHNIGEQQLRFLEFYFPSMFNQNDKEK